MATITINTGDNAQQKIDASAAGDTIIIADGFQSAGLTLRNDRTYDIRRIVGLNNSGFTIIARGLRNAVVSVFLDNANMDIDGSDGCKYVLKGRNFVSRPGDAARHCVYFANMTRCTLSGPEFRNMLAGDTCVFGYSSTDCVFEDFYCYSVHEAIHIVNSGRNTTIRRIYIDGIRRHGVEVQGEHDGLLIDTVYVKNRMANGMDISCATGGKHGQVGNGTTNTSRNVKVRNCVLDQGNRGSHPWSQSCGLEAMGQIEVEDCWFVNTGQGVLYGAVGPDWAVRRCMFKQVEKPMSGEPIAFTFPPKPENYVGNNENYTGAIPTWEQLLANGGGTPQPPPTGSTMNVTAKAYKTYVDLTLDFTGSVGTTALERRAGDGVWSQLATWQAGQTGTKPFKDSQFSADQIANTWKFWYRLRDKNGQTPEAEVQIGVNADPVPPQPTQPRKIVKSVHTFDDGSTQTMP